MLDAGTQEVTREGVVLQIPRLSFKLLLSLARHAPNIVSAQQLEEEVWEGLVVDRGTVNKRALLLRKALGEDQAQEPYIAVIRGSGYRLVAQVDRVMASADEPGPEEKTPQNWYQRSSSFIHTTSYWLLGIVAILALYHGGVDPSRVQREQIFEQSGVALTQAANAPLPQKSIAVLPFVDLSNDQSHRYLGDGLAEEVINSLARMDGLQVAARTSSFAFRDTVSTAVEIASKLRVGSILEGSIQTTDGRIRISAQLVDAQSGYRIWSQNYDRSFEEVFEVQDDIAINIAQSLKLTMDENRLSDSRRSMTGDLGAFKLYLKGRELLNNRIHLRSEGLLGALEYFGDAVETDPKFARAHAGIATVYWLLPSYDRSLDKETYFEEAEASANFALELDPVSIDALGALAAVRAERGDIDRAIELFNQIKIIGGFDSNIVTWEAQLLVRLGYFEEVVKPLTEAYRRDPLNEHVAWSLADALIYSGKPAEAPVILHGLEHFIYRDYYLGLSAIYTGEYDLARELFHGVQMRSGILPSDYADMLIDGLEDPSLKEDIATAFVSANKEGVLNKLVSFESLLILGSPRAFDLGVDPFKDITNMHMHAELWNNWAVDLRQDPRFKDWVKELGYVDFWHKFGWPDRCRPTGLDGFECI